MSATAIRAVEFDAGHVVAKVEHMLVEARAGRIRAFVAILDVPGDSYDIVWTDARTAELVGLVEIAKYRLLADAPRRDDA